MIYKPLFEVRYKFNTKTTGMSYYDSIMESPDYHRYYKGIVYEIVQMKPTDFIREIRKSSGKDPMTGVDYKIVDKYTEKIKKGVKFDMPVLEYFEDGYVAHEGRHRAMAMENLIVRKIDVMIVRHIKPDHDTWFKKK